MTSSGANNLQEYGRKAADTIETRRIPAADALHRAAEVLERKTQNWDKGQQAARGLHQAAHYVRDHDVDTMWSDFEGAIRKYPGYALGVAAAFGFLCGRALFRR